MTDIKCPASEDYRPYNVMPEFTQGIEDYTNGRHENPHGTTNVAAQAWDRGSEYAMRVVRYNEGH
jgi:hypothetical protein